MRPLPVTRPHLVWTVRALAVALPVLLLVLLLRFATLAPRPAVTSRLDEAAPATVAVAMPTPPSALVQQARQALAQARTTFQAQQVTISAAHPFDAFWGCDVVTVSVLASGHPTPAAAQSTPTPDPGLGCKFSRGQLRLANESTTPLTLDVSHRGFDAFILTAPAGSTVVVVQADGVDCAPVPGQPEQLACELTERDARAVFDVAP